MRGEGDYERPLTEPDNHLAGFKWHLGFIGAVGPGSGSTPSACTPTRPRAHPMASQAACGSSPGNPEAGDWASGNVNTVSAPSSRPVNA